MTNSLRDKGNRVDALARELNVKFEGVVVSRPNTVPSHTFAERSIGMLAALPEFGDEPVDKQVQLMAHSPISRNRIDGSLSAETAWIANALTSRRSKIGGRYLVKCLICMIYDWRMIYSITLWRMPFTVVAK